MKCGDNVSCVIMISNNNFPNGNAGAVREEMLGRMFVNRGYTVHQIGMNSSTKGIDNYKSITVHQLGSNRKGLAQKIDDFFIWGVRMKNTLGKLVAQEKDCTIILTGLRITQINMIIRISQKYGCRLVYNAVEWYSIEHFKLRHLSRVYINNDLINKYILNKQFSVIAISEYLYQYFNSKQIRSINIPFIIDTREIIPVYQSNEKVVFSYVGVSSRKKDYIFEMLNAFAELPEDYLKRIEINIVGMSTEALKKRCGVTSYVFNKLSNCLHILGRVSRDQATYILSRSDFSILLRSETMRYAKAGFPTKVTEALAYGIPMITNITSDLGDFLKDGTNSIVVENESSNAFRKAVERAIAMDQYSIRRLKMNARLTAETKLDYRVYEDNMLAFIG